MTTFTTIFDFYKLGVIECTIKGRTYKIYVEVSEHGTRFRTETVLSVETLEGTIEKQKTVYFGEGLWLALPNIEDAVLEILGGSEEEVEELSEKYDDLLTASLPELITGNLVKGFVKRETERLQSESDLQS